MNRSGYCLVIIIIAAVLCMGTIPALAAEWHNETVDSTGDMGMHSSVSLVSPDIKRIAYYDATNDDLKYAWKTSGAWHISTIDSGGNVGYHPSMTSDEEDVPHVSYYDVTNQDLKYAYNDATGWHRSTVASTGDVGLYSSIAMWDGEPRISYSKASVWPDTESALKYAWHDATGWHTTTIDTSSLTGLYTTLAVDPATGYARICYYDAENVALKYAWQDAAGWHTTTVERIGGLVSVGSYCSLALDADGNPHISYARTPNDDLKYAWKDALGWHNESVDLHNNVGEYTSIAIDSHGYPHISYYTNSFGELRYASRRDSGTWDITTVDSDGAGWWTSLELDENDYPYISYWDQPNTNLKFAWLSGNREPVAITDTYTVWQDTTLEVPAPGILANDYDPDGNPLTAELWVGASSGTVTLNTDGSFTYTPEAGFTGTVIFSYRAYDGSLYSPAVVVYLDVKDNHAPKAKNDYYQTLENTVLTVPKRGVLANDTDSDGDTLTAIPKTKPLHGKAHLYLNGSFTYTPENDYTGKDSFTYVANDGKVDSTPATVEISIVRKLKPMPGLTLLPKDINNDGKFEDLNGNGRIDFNDVVWYFRQMTWIAKNEPVDAFDYNTNSRIDFSDIVTLFRMV